MAPTTMKYISKIKDARVLVIGGSSGIGFGVAEAAVEYGAIVTISSSSQVRIDSALSRLRSSYPDSASKVSGFPCDLSDPTTLESNIESLLKSSTKDSERFNHIIFTAGDALSIMAPTEFTFEKIQKAGIVRFYAPALLCKYAPQYMISSKSSSITLTGGVGSAKPAPSWTPVAAWLSAVEGMMRGLAVDLAPIRVNLVRPGAIQTELFDSVPEEGKEQYRKETLVGSIGSPEDVAEAYLYCMKSEFVDGDIVSCDGGRLLK